jgi:cytochrome c oxidase subunit 2
MNSIYCYNLYSPSYDFLDSGSYVMDGIVSLHDHILFYEIIVLLVVVWILGAVLLKKNKFILKDIYHGSVIEIVWTLVPGIILVLIALPSFRLLYLMDDYLDTSITVKIIGNQWFWNYNYGDVEFDAYPSQDLSRGFFRWLDTDEHLILPANTPIRLLVTSSDVVHSWSIPSLGVKMDAIPGRLNQTGLEIYRPGLYFGQCYELCGVAHSFMPITLKVI